MQDMMVSIISKSLLLEIKMYRYTVAGILTLRDCIQRTVYFTEINDDGLPVCSLYKSNAYFFNMRKDAIFIANALNAFYEVDTFKIKLFRFEEV